MRSEQELMDMLIKLDSKEEDYCNVVSYYEGVKTTLLWALGSSNEEPVE